MSEALGLGFKRNVPEYVISMASFPIKSELSSAAAVARFTLTSGAARARTARQRARNVFMNIIVVVVQTAQCGGGEQEEYRGEERTGRLYTLDTQCIEQ